MKLRFYMGIEELFSDSTFTLEDIFVDIVGTSYLFVLNQEEKDYCSGLQLMYGRTLTIRTVDEYVKELSIARDDPYFAMPFTYYATYELLKTS